MTRPVLLEVAAAALLLAVFTAFAVGEAWHQSVTVDEFHLVPQGLILRATGNLEVGYKTPPLLKRWVALAIPAGSVTLPDPVVEGRVAASGWDPWILGTRFMVANAAGYDAIFRRARLAMLPIAWALGIAVFLWARAVAGPVAGLAALALFAFAPEMIAFSSLVSLDLAVAALVVDSLALLRLHVARRSPAALLCAGGLFGLALAVKLSTVVLAPLFLAVLLPPGDVRSRRRRLALLLLANAVAILALHACYGFDRPLPRFGEVHATSRQFRTLAAVVPAWFRVPLPYQWLRALDGQARDVETADVPSYLDGTWSNRGWGRYYLMAWLYKTPLALLALVLLLAVLAARRARGRPGLDVLLLAVPIVLWGAAFSFGGGLEIGIRYVLPCYALGAVALGVALARLVRSRVEQVAAGALLLAYALGSAAAYPHHLAYFNLLGGSERNGWRHLVDSNLDWGQELAHLARYVRERGIGRIGLGYFGHVAPEMYGIDYFVPNQGAPEPGWYAVSANFVAGYPYLVTDHGRLRMLPQDHFAAFRALDPIDTVGGALRIYRVGP